MPKRKSRTACASGSKRRRTGGVGKKYKGRAKIRSKFKSRAGSKTKQIYQKPRQTVPGMAGAGTFSTFSNRHAMKAFDKKLLKDLAMQNLSTVEGLRVAWGENNQVASCPAVCWNHADMNKCFSLGTTLGDTDNLNTRRLYIQSMNTCVNISNPTSAPVMFDIYDIMYRHDMPQHTASGAYNIPNSLWYDGLQDMGDIGSGLLSDPGNTPFMSPKFTQNLKVMKVTKVQLPQGGTHEHRVHAEVNQMLSYENVMNSGLYYYKGKTVVSMIVVRGTPVDDGTNVGLCAGALNMVVTQKYQFHMIRNSVSTFVTTNTLPTLTAERIINIGSGAAEAVNMA